MPFVNRPLFQPYLVAVLAVGLALGLTFLLQPILASAIFTLFYLAVIISALYGGMGAGSFASVLSAIACQYFFLPPARSLAIGDRDTLIWLLTVLGMALLISGLSAAFRQAQRSAKSAMRQLRASEAHYRRLIDTANEGIWLLDADLRTRYVNERLAEMLGYSAAEMQGRSMRDFMDEAAQQQAEPHFARQQQGGRTRYEARYRRKDGTPLWAIVSVNATLDAGGGFAEALAMLVDISDAKREEAIRRQAEELRQQAEAEKQAAEVRSQRAEAERQRIEIAQQQTEAERQRLESEQEQIEAARQAEEQERQRVEEALRQSEARFFQLSEQIQDVFWTMTLTGETLYVSPAYEEIWGRPRRSLYENSADWTAAVHPDDQAQVQLSFPKLQLGESVEIEYRVIRPDGSIRWVRDRGFPIRRNGELYQLAGIVEDITARKQEELRRQQAEQRLKLYADIVENAQVGISVWQLSPTDRGDRLSLVAANPAADQMIGVPLHQNIGAEMSEIFPALPDGLFQAYVGVVQTGVAQNLDAVRYQDSQMNSVFAVKAFPLPNQCIGLAFENITERKQTEEALRDALQRLTVHFENSPLGVIERDRDLRIIRWSKTAEHIFGWQAEEVLGKDRQDFIHPDDAIAVAQLRQRLLSGTDKQNISYNRNFTKSGAIVYCEWYDSVVFDEAGNIASLLSLVHDVTGRRQAEQEREQLLAREQSAREAAEAANHSKDEFLAVLSHELRSPLNPILGWTKLLQTRKFDEEGRRRALETIERNARLQAQLVDDLLDVSRIIGGKLRLDIHSVSLAAVVEAAIDTVQFSADAKAIALTFQPPTDRDAFTVAGDANRLQQIVWNLLSNAIKFTPSGGRVEVTLKAVSEDSDPPTRASIVVSDTGNGIVADFLPYVFDYFRQADSTTTRSVGGLGLGLAIVRHLVELHGGSVWAESPGKGRGATFTVMLPLTQSSNLPDPTPMAEPEQPPSSDRSPDLVPAEPEIFPSNPLDAAIDSNPAPHAIGAIPVDAVVVEPDPENWDDFDLDSLGEALPDESALTIPAAAEMQVSQPQEAADDWIDVEAVATPDHTAAESEDPAEPQSDEWSEWDDEEMTEWLSDTTAIAPADPAPATPTEPDPAAVEGEEAEEPPIEPEPSPPPDAELSAELTDLRVLIVDDEADMREFLASALEAQGAVVFLVSSAAEALTAISAIQPDLLISDIGLPDQDGYQLIQAVRSLPPAAGGDIPAIALTDGSETDRSSALSAGFQQHLAKPIDAAALVEAIESVRR